MGAAKSARNNAADSGRRARPALLALGYVAVWVALWHVSSVLELSAGVSLWYPPAGLTFAILIEYGARALPLPILAALIAGLSIGSWEQWPYFLLINLVTPLSYMVAAQALRGYPPERLAGKWHFNDPQRVAIFLAAAAAASLFAALIGVQILRFADLSPSQTPLSRVVLGWWVGDFIGVATFAPLALVFAAPLARRFRRGRPPRRPKSSVTLDAPSVRLALFQGLLSLLLLAALFWAPQRFWHEQQYPFMTLLLLPILAWTVATRDIRGTLVTVFLYELGIVVMVAWFGRPELRLQYQIVMAAVVASGLLTGAVSQAWLASIARFRDLAEVSNDLLWEVDADGRLRELGGRLTGTATPSDSHLGVSWRVYIVPQEQDSDLAALKTALRRRRPFQQLVLRARLPGKKGSIWTRNSGLPLFGEDGEFLGYRGATTDITTYKKAEAVLRNYSQTLEVEVAARTRILTETSQRNWRMANFDHLTGLPNRNLFFEHLRKGLRQARRQRRLLAVLLVDLDGFKEVNDTFGHDTGDELLRQVAERLRCCVRATDTAARLGGDEFTVLLTDLEYPQGAITVAQKIIVCLAEPLPLGEANVTVTASVGIALYRPESADSLEQAMLLMRQADAAMYAAKRAGKNAWRLAESLDPESS